MRSLHVVTHPEVEVDPAVPVPAWRLSAPGSQRVQSWAREPWVWRLAHVFSSAEGNARETASVLAAVRGLPVQVG